MAKHTCNDGAGPHFGRKTPGCARCDELAAGAEPTRRNTRDARLRADINRRQARLRDAGERARAAVAAQLPSCCQNSIAAWTISTGHYRSVTVRDCPRHGTVNVEIRPVPHLLYPDPPTPSTAIPTVLPEQLY